MGCDHPFFTSNEIDRKNKNVVCHHQPAWCQKLQQKTVWVQSLQCTNPPTIDPQNMTCFLRCEEILSWKEMDFYVLLLIAGTHWQVQWVPFLLRNLKNVDSCIRVFLFLFFLPVIFQFYNWLSVLKGIVYVCTLHSSPPSYVMCREIFFFFCVCVMYLF